jgi:SepF-like predicted cell division protein (DUF552 family)
MQLNLKTISIHSYSQLHELKKSLLSKQNNIILIARLTPILSKDIEAGAKLVDELYSIAINNNYSVCRLGEERIIVFPAYIRVKERIMEGIPTTKSSTPNNI